ncbi:MAG TPA: choice-of-anchor B family protein, partial [candidate division Zixibacteria bacterium]|nr:choice-of-anchor B family protein [candidate division Zixibacteria bacterium]
APDNLWNPSDDGSLAGGREYLFIMSSDYDGTGLTYAGINISSGSPDVLYAMWPKLQSGAALHDSDPASLFIKPHYLPLTMSNFYALLPTDSELDLRWIYTGPPTDVIRLYSGVSYPPDTLLAEFDPATENFLHTGLTPGQSRYYYLGAYDTAIIADCCVVPGDADHSGTLNIADVSFVIGFIFSGGAAPPCQAEADADGSGSVNIADVSYVIAFIFSGGPAPTACPGSDTTFTLIGESLDLVVTPQSVSSGVSLVGAWNQRGTYGDCWGYEADGVEYALICARNEGVSIIDIDATPPTEVGFIPSIAPGMDAKDVKIYQNFAIVIKEYEPIQIVDLTDVTNPSQVATIQPVGSSGAHNCMVDGDYLYVVGNHSIGGLEIFNIANPAAPFLAGSFQQFYYHDVDIRNDTLYAAGIYGNGIDILNISSKAAPVRIDQFNYTGSGAHNCELLGATDYVAIGDEIGSSGNHVRIFNVSDPANATLASEIIVDPQAVTHNCYELNGLLYIAYYTEGLRVWDVNDPNNPFEVGYFDTFTGSGYGYQGAWNTYPYYTSGRIIVS